jgi:signal peptidase I
MNPTILEGDRLLVDKHVYGVRIPWTLVRLTSGRDPMRGEIVVFDSPADGTSLVKRVIAVPGDVVSLDEQGLMVNGKRAHYSAGDESHLKTLLSETIAMDPQVLRESGFGPTHDVLALPNRYARRVVAPLRVPEDMYFMMGDNRDNSEDSRFIGPVPRQLLIGRAHHIVVSADILGWWKPRFERIAAPIR